MKTTVIAVIGCGAIANSAHFPALVKLKNVKIKYAVDIIEERALKAKADYGIDKAEKDYHVALNDKEVDAVYVLTPNYLHYTITMDALRAGKHVFCEKPITVNYKLSKEMRDLAEQNGLMLNIGVCNRYNRSVELLKKMCEQGEFGDLYHVYCSFRNYRSIPGLGGNFTTKAVSGGGVLIDWGVHFLDLILHIIDAKVKTVSAACYSEMAKNISDYAYNYMWAGPPVLDGVNDVEDFVTGFARTDKASITLNGAWAQNINKDEMFIDFLGSRGGARLTYGGKFTVYTQRNGILEEVSPMYEIPNMYELEDKAFIECLNDGVKNRGNIDYVIETAKIMDAIYESAAINKEVAL